MAGFFFQLGKLAGPKVRKAKWIFRSLAGSEAEAIQAEFEFGRDMAQAIVQEMEVDPEPAICRWLQEIGARLARSVKNRDRKFTFHVVRSDDANAFALPGGFIWVTESLIKLCGSDPDEVAFILGHEMGHVIHKHAMDRMMTSSVLDMALHAAPGGLLMRSQLGGVLRELLNKGYSQDQEFDADSLAVRLARIAGYRPTAAIQMLNRLKQQSGELKGFDQYFSTHPPFELRIAKIKRLLDS